MALPPTILIRASAIQLVGMSVSGKEEERVPFNRNSSWKIVAPCRREIFVNRGVKEGMNAV
jgi:hypothetical protein